MDAQEIWEMLMRYDRELIVPRFAAIDKRRFDSMVTRDEFLGRMDGIDKQFMGVDTE